MVLDPYLPAEVQQHEHVEEFGPGGAREIVEAFAELALTSKVARIASSISSQRLPI